jgi:phosphatidylserine/phosphatidylglycerophosphate/cardiolipin synthase-like enzyme
MELIHPAEISGKIMTLIDQAKEEIIIVSPYNKFTYWKKLTQRIEKAQQRGIRIQWYIRKDIPHNVEQIRQIGVEPIEVENLHCKMYLNDQHAVFTSMNLHQFSDSSSIDIGYLITEEDKYKELRDFISTYIDTSVSTKTIIRRRRDTTVPLKKNVFIDDLLSLLLKLGFKQECIERRRAYYGQVLSINQFVADKFQLILEPKGTY